MRTYTKDQMDFIKAVENNRGEIKDKNKYYEMLCDVHTYATSGWKLELKERKTVGIKFVFEVVTILDRTTQNDLLIDILSLDKITAAQAKMLFNNYKLAI